MKETKMDYKKEFQKEFESMCYNKGLNKKEAWGILMEMFACTLSNQTEPRYNVRQEREEKYQSRILLPKRRHPIDGWTKEECAKEYAKTYIDNINNALKTDFEFSAENYSEVLAEAVKTYARKVFTGEFSCEQIGKDRDLIISILGYYKGKRSPLEKTYDALKNGFSLSAGYINNIMPEFFKMYAQEAMDENDNEKLLYAASILKSNEK